MSNTQLTFPPLRIFFEYILAETAALYIPLAMVLGGAKDAGDTLEAKVELGVFEGARCNGLIRFFQF